jgi:hypothetical protein
MTTEVRETKVQETAIGPLTRSACDVATGRVLADPTTIGTSIVGAKKDLNSKGRGEHWYRMVHRHGWRYVSDDRLPSASFRAAERRCEVYGDVYPGEIVVSHDRGQSIDCAWLVRAPDSAGKVLVRIEFSSRRDGNLVFTLPDASEVVLSNPRSR